MKARLNSTKVLRDKPELPGFRAGPFPLTFNQIHLSNLSSGLHAHATESYSISLNHSREDISDSTDSIVLFGQLSRCFGTPTELIANYCLHTLRRFHELQ